MGWNTMIHVPPSDHAYIKRLAKERRMTMAGFVGVAVRKYVGPERRQVTRITGKKQLERIDDSPSPTVDYAPFWAGRRRG